VDGPMVDCLEETVILLRDLSVKDTHEAIIASTEQDVVL